MSVCVFIWGDGMEKKELRCANCNRLLAKTNGDTEVVCIRCGYLNIYNAKTGKVECSPKRRVSSSGVQY